MSKHLEPYYKTLGLEVGASLEEINEAYRDLAFIWHPDRIPSDNPRLLEKAATKLQEINHARDQLRALNSHPKKKKTWRPPRRGPARGRRRRSPPPPPKPTAPPPQRA
ncbi:MAG: J domain-containing protein, partial [Microcystaceae cyanobacterium]